MLSQGVRPAFLATAAASSQSFPACSGCFSSSLSSVSSPSALRATCPLFYHCALRAPPLLDAPSSSAVPPKFKYTRSSEGRAGIRARVPFSPHPMAPARNAQKEEGRGVTSAAAAAGGAASSSAVPSAPEHRVVPPPPKAIVAGCGGAGVDYLATVESYPNPDDKIRTRELQVQGGGNVGNALTAAARLGLQTRIFTKVADDSLGQGILAELQTDGVDTSHVIVGRGGVSPFTYIIVDQETATRTCIHTPGTPPLASSELSDAAIDHFLAGADVAYFDARLAACAVRIARKASAMQIPVLLDAEKPREGLDDLLALSDYVVCTEKFPQKWTGAPSLGAALLLMLQRLPHVAFLIVTRGAQGCVMLDRRASPCGLAKRTVPLSVQAPPAVPAATARARAAAGAIEGRAGAEAAAGEAEAGAVGARTGAGAVRIPRSQVDIEQVIGALSEAAEEEYAKSWVAGAPVPPGAEDKSMPVLSPAMEGYKGVGVPVPSPRATAPPPVCKESLYLSFAPLSASQTQAPAVASVDVRGNGSFSISSEEREGEGGGGEEQTPSEAPAPVEAAVAVCTAWRLRPEQVVDTTGAGDAFIGAVLYGLCAGLPRARMLALAATVAAAKCQALGARPGLPRRTDALVGPYLDA